jgi:putative endonuclease
VRLPFNNNKTGYATGIWAEYYAAAYLLLNGYIPLAMRYKTKNGEIDYIAKRGKTTIFVEVKYREKEDSALEAVSPKSQSRIRRAAEHYILGQEKESDKFNLNYRFDVIAIYNNYKIRHIKNAF